MREATEVLRPPAAREAERKPLPFDEPPCDPAKEQCADSPWL